MKMKALRILAITLLFLLGLSALAGGLALIIDPTGKLIMMPGEFLEGTPFTDYLIPGVFLILMNGIPAILIAVFTIRKTEDYALMIIGQGFLLLTWLVAQLSINLSFFFPVMHIPCFTIAFALILCGFRIYDQEDWKPL